MREFLSQRGVSFVERDFFREPFSRQEIEQLLGGQSPRVLFNPRSSEVKKRGLDIKGVPDAELLELMLQEPRFILRPIVVIDGHPYFGAQEQVLAPLLP